MTTFLPLSHDVSLQSFNTFGIAACAKLYLPISERAQLLALHDDARLAALPRLLLGGGSNLVLSDQVDALVLHMRLQGIRICAQDSDFTYVQAAAGESWHGLVEWTLAHGLAGLENLSLIPGTVGAAPVQNIGAYGVELKDVLHELEVYDFATGAWRIMARAECQFAYRESIFKQALRDRVAIVSVTLALPRRWQPQLGYADLQQSIAALGPNVTAAQISAAISAIRRAKLPDPAVIGNAGSFFKNPLVPAAQRAALLLRWPELVSYAQADGSYKLAAGWLIEQCGWKGRSLGRAGVYEKQALVLVNRGHASGAEVRALAQAVQDDVVARFGVRLEMEPVFV